MIYNKKGIDTVHGSIFYKSRVKIRVSINFALKSGTHKLEETVVWTLSGRIYIMCRSISCRQAASSGASFLQFSCGTSEE